MIYYFNIKTEWGEKQFYLTADDHKQLYRRIQSTYGVLKDQVELLAEYKETPNDGYELVKSYVDISKDIDSELLKEANKLYREAGRKDEPYKSEYLKKHKYSEIVAIDNYKEIAPLLEKHKKVKVYWELGEKRGQHNYYVMVK